MLTHVISSHQAQTQLTTVIATLQNQLLHLQVQELVGKAHSQGKCPPALKDTWLSIGLADLAALQNLAQMAPTYAKV